MLKKGTGMLLQDSPRFQPNELYPELLGVLGMSPFKGNNSASRDQMFSSHLGQSLVISGSSERYIQTGMEREYGKYTFSKKMPVDVDIIRVIPRYPQSIDAVSIRHNPETLVIYEDAETKMVGYMSLPDFFSHHQYFGFPYKRKPVCSRLRTGEHIAKDTILLDSPSVNDTGGYMPGTEANVAFMSVPGVAEDGLVVRRGFLPKLSFKTYETRVVEWGSKNFPVNAYGDANHYKPHPDIGDLIREDGLLMALRTYDDMFAPVEQSVKKTLEVDPIFDTATYADGPGMKLDGATYTGRVIDIRVMHDINQSTSTPIGMEVQTERYDNARRRFYQEIYSVYQGLVRRHGPKLQTTQEFQQLVVDAISVIGAARKKENEYAERVIMLRRGVPLDDWWVEFVIEYHVTPTIGFKLTDCHGG